MLGWILKKALPIFSKEVWERVKKRVKNRQQNSENASHDYNNPYKKRHGQLQVFCVGMEAQRSVDDVYVAAQFLAKRKATKHNSTEDSGKVFLQKGREYFTSTSDKHQDGMRVATNEQYLMVLGVPGVGKSTFLRKVGLEALKGVDGSFEHESTPVFLELKRFTEDPIDIEAWIINEFKVCGYPHPERIANDKLEAGELLILFDGLDEVPKPNVSNVINKIRDFVNQYSQNRFIASCRVGAYKGELTDFTVVEITDFDDSQIQDYINNWLASASDRKKKIAQRCWQALNASEHQAIKVLAQNPLSLAMLCQVYEDSQEFPSNEAILYGKILNIFLKKWTAEKHVHRDPPMSPYLAIPTVKELLSEIAAENFKADRLVFSEDELTNQIQEFYQRRTDISSQFDATEILDAILVDPGLFVERANGIYTFFHLTFQEYLTANYIVGHPQSIQQLVTEHLHDERWREVFLLTAGLMREADDLLIAMEAEAAKFINTDRLKSLFRWAKRKTNTTDNRYNGLIKRAFAICQYFSLKSLNETDEEYNKIVKYNIHFYRYLDINLAPFLYRYLSEDIHRDLYSNRPSNPHRDQNPYIDTNDTNLYLDPYQHVDTYFYRLFSTSNRNQFDEELLERITFVERMKQMKIFKKVNLQRMVDRFNSQREFIKAAGKGETVEPPTASIHKTWLAVLGITNNMIAISNEELENCHWYLRSVELIIACKEAAGRVSPKVWQEIEEKLLA